MVAAVSHHVPTSKSNTSHAPTVLRCSQPSTRGTIVASGIRRRSVTPPGSVVVARASRRPWGRASTIPTASAMEHAAE